jgi:alpha-methylacyl-CoA racemase
LFAFALVCGLYEARASGVGQVIDCAVIDASLLIGAKFGIDTAAERQPPSHIGAPFYNVYPVADGRQFAVAAVEPRLYRELLTGLGLPADVVAAAVAGQHDRSSWPDRRELVAAAFRAHDSSHWTQCFAELDAGVTAVLSAADGRGAPEVRDGKGYVAVDGDWQPSPAPLFSRTPGRVGGPVVAAGADTREILDGLGYSNGEVADLIDNGVVGVSRTIPL